MAVRSDFSVQFWTDRAEEARARADQMHDPVAKRTMEVISDAYDRLAERARSRLLSEAKSIFYPN